MKKIKELIIKHKGVSILTLLVVLLVLITSLMFFSMFLGGSSNKYGNRLDGIKDVNISKEKLDNVRTSTDEEENVKTTEIRIQGKIVYIEIKVKEDTNQKDAKKIAEKVLEEFSEKELGFYDFSFFLIEDKEDGYVITGNKHPKKEEIGWIKS